MRLLALELSDVGGLERARVVLPVSGASVLPAPNEHGKSTLVAALHLLITEKASAKGAVVRDLRRRGVDRPSRVAAELLLGGVRLRLEKTWDLRRGTTLLELLDEGTSLSGDEAHEEFRRRFEAHVDRGLYDLLRFAQLRKLEPIAAGTSPTVTARLADAAAAEPADDALLAAVTAFAASNWHQSAKEERPIGELKMLVDEVTALSQRRDALAASVAAGSGIATDLAELTEAAERLRSARAELDGRAAARADAQALALVRERALAAIARAEERSRLLADVERTAVALEASTRRRDDATAELAGLARGLTEAQAAESAADSALAAARSREAGVRTQRIRELVAERDAALARVAAEQVDAELVRRADGLEVTLAIEQAALAGGAWRLRARAGHELEVEVDGERLTLAPGDTLERDVLAAFAHAGEDGSEFRLTAPEDAAERATRAAALRQELAELLSAAGVDDVGTLRVRAGERAAAEAAAGRASAELTGLLGDDDLATVLGPDAPEAATGIGSHPGSEPGSEPEVAAAVPSVIDAEAALGAARQARSAVSARHDALAAGIATAEQDVVTAAAAHASAVSTLDRAREQEPDATVDAAAAGAREALGQLGPDPDAGASGTGEDVASVEADVAAERSAIDTELERIAERRTALDAQRQLVSREAGELEDLERELVPREQERDRRLDEARAARRLAERLRSARDAQADRYQQPLRERIADHLVALLGPGADVELDEALRVRRRTRAGEDWLDWERLSVGAREQLTVVTGLAMAELAGDDGVPFLLDDAIVHSDAGRAARLAELLAGTTAQVVVLTCRQDLLGPLTIAEHELVPAARDPLDADRSGPTAQ